MTVQPRPNKNRWGMFSSPATVFSAEDLTADHQHQLSPTNLLAWEDIDHTQTLELGDSGSTSLVFRKDFDTESAMPNYFTLRACHPSDFTAEKKQLVEMAVFHNNALFLHVRCAYSYGQQLFVGSELADMSLADIIDCTIPIDEVHLSAVLHQVSPPLGFSGSS